MPRSNGSTSAGVDSMHPVTSLIHSLFKLESSSFVCLLCDQTGARYSASKWQRARADVRSIRKSEPRELPERIFRMLQRTFVFAVMFSRCCL